MPACTSFLAHKVATASDVRGNRSANSVTTGLMPTERACVTDEPAPAGRPTRRSEFSSALKALIMPRAYRKPNDPTRSKPCDDFIGLIVSKALTMIDYFIVHAESG
jgi:hypothetical protein